jgi:DNA invertase Pin-like site-specific DNA recombinase
MRQAAPKRQRCAIYTRKSTEHNLDLAFNSLDAQREACEAYIKSQAHEGWTLVPAHFDDGGLSGASLDRPALQSLLDEVRARKIDVIVVYKVDRLTRSLADFAKLVELFDEHDVSFVSVTQSFNTTSSMGRLTLNVLLSFAQFEREVIGERVRDKIAASKRKGLWVGGPIPLGYRSVDKKLQIVPDEADLVRKIFNNYLAFGSVGALTASLNAEGLKPKARRPTNGRTVAAGCYRIGPLAHLLKNRFYIGEIAYRGEVHHGGHEAILERALFEAVQAWLKEQTVERRLVRRRSPNLLTGRLFDDGGNPMSPTPANKKGVRYRYYTSQALLQGSKAKAGSLARVAATEIETLVIEALRAKCDAEPPSSDRDMIDRHLDRAVVHKDSIVMELRQNEESQSGPDAAETISMPYGPTMRPLQGVAREPNVAASLTEADRAALLAAIARSKAWIETILHEPSQTFATIAASEKLSERYIKLLTPLAFVSPRLVEAIADGRAPATLTVTSLARDLPISWAEQESRYSLI